MHPEALRSNYLLESLSPSELEEVRKISTVTLCPKGKIIFYEGEQAQTLHLVLSGSVTVYKCDARGNEIVMGQFTQGDLFAEMPCFDHGSYPASARCEEAGEILKIDYPAFEARFFANPVICMKFLKSMSLKIKQLETTIKRNVTMDATQKVARFICEQPERYAKMKQKEVAALLTMAPETLSRVIKRLTQDGLLRGEAGHYEIADEAGLRRIYEI